MEKSTEMIFTKLLLSLVFLFGAVGATFIFIIAPIKFWDQYLDQKATSCVIDDIAVYDRLSRQIVGDAETLNNRLVLCEAGTNDVLGQRVDFFSRKKILPKFSSGTYQLIFGFLFLAGIPAVYLIRTWLRWVFKNT